MIGRESMKREEFKILVKAMKAVYTKPDFIPDADAFNVWYSLLQDLSYMQAQVAIQRHMTESKFPPTIADIREKAEIVSIDAPKDWSDGWEEVLKAIRKYGRYREDEALENMSEVTKRAVQRLGFQEICNSENITADRANFRMIYEQIQEREQKEARMPAYLKELIQRAQLELKENGNLLEG